MIVNVENLGHSLKVSHYTSSGDLQFMELPIPNDQRFVWKKTSPSDRLRDPVYKTWDGFPVKKVYTEKYDKYRLVELLESFDKQETKDLWDFQMAKKYFVDIEVEMTENRADALDTIGAKNKIVTIAIASSNKKLLVLGLEKLTPDQILKIEKRINDHFKNLGAGWIFNYRHFESEFDMIYTFMAKLLSKLPLVTGWNWFGYDWPYLLNRSKRLGIETSICSPAGILIGKKQIPMHVLMVDYIEIYKKWDRVIKIRESNSLDYVSKASVGIGKIQYNGSLQDLYTSDFETYIFYNAIDSGLVYYIDQKINTLTTFFKVAQVSAVEIDRALSPVWTTEVLMIRKFLERNQVVVYEMKDEVAKKFEGAYVKEPIAGMHEWIGCLDFSSLYPTLIRQWGISPEIYIGKDLKNPPPGAIRTANNAYFYSKEGNEPILRSVLDNLYSIRKVAKEKYFECQIEIDKIEQAIREKQ